MTNSSITKHKSNYNRNYYQAAKNGLLGFGVCNAENCISFAISKKGFCNRHLGQLKKYGSTFKTYYDPSFIEQTENECLIHLCDRFGNVRDKAIIDKDDFSKANGCRWHLSLGYAVTGSNGKYLHHVIMGDIPVGYQIDHIDMNRLNNRKSNLRIATIMQNSYNQKVPKNNTSGFKGVSWNSKIKKYVSQIQYNKTHLMIGSFNTKLEASEAYNKKAKELHGEFAAINQ